MAAHFFRLPIFIFTFLMVSSILSSAQEISLVKEPEDNYYIVKKLPVVIVCQAKNAAEISFTCLGTQIPSTSVEVKDVSDIDPALIEAEIEVTRADVQNSESLGQFWCQCSALDFAGNVVVTSRKANVSFASLKSKFQTEPKSASLTVGQDVEFACEAPEGKPEAEIMWRKDKKRLEVENNPRIYVSGKNSLIIQSVTLADKGQYQCVAKNVAGRRESQEAQLTVTALAESAEPDLELLEKDISSKKAAGAAGKLRATRQSIKTYFTTEPQEKYYITKDKPLLVDCGVVAADILTFRCHGKRMERDRQTMTQGLDSNGNRVIKAQLSLTYEEGEQILKESQRDKGFQCICVAWYHDSGDPNGWGKLDSNIANGFIHLAYLDTVFQTEPSDVTVGLNSDVNLVCDPPKGQPSPWVHWYKDLNRLDPRTTEKYSMNAKGHLTIHHVENEDAGSYHCLAENSVSSAQSRPGRLTVSAEAIATTTVAASEDGFPTFPAVIPSSPVFLRDFESEYTLTPDGTRKMVCAVVSAEQMTIDCGGQRLPPAGFELKSEIDRETGKRLLYLTTEITADMMQKNPDDYFCQCTAWYLNEQMAWERLTSSKGFIRQAPEQAFIEEDFESLPVDTSASYESGAELQCVPPHGYPVPTVYWLKDGERIDTDEDPNFVVVDSGSLYIELVRVSDEGEYICAAENRAGYRKSPPIKFTVLDKPDTEDEVTTESESESEVTTTGYDTSTFELEEPVFVGELSPEYYIVDDIPVTLSCIVVAAKTLVFVCNGEILKETATTGYHFLHPQTQQTLRENSLTVTRDKVDEYTGSEPYSCLCRAYYQKEGSTPGETLTVESVTATIQVAYLDENFIEEPSDTEVKNFERVELRCRAPSGVPTPTVSWLKDNSLISESERIRVEDSGSLIIERFTVDDEGAYRCEVNNTFDRLTSQPARVTLIDSSRTFPTPDAEPETRTTPSDTEKLYSGSPYISKDLHSVYYLVKNKPVTITCEAYSVEVITFTCGMKNVEDQQTRERLEELSLPNGQSSLVTVVEGSINVSKSEVEDYEAGKNFWCTCHAHYHEPGTDAPKKLESSKGYVEIASLKKIFQKEPENQTVEEGESLSIFCQPPTGNPQPTVTWTRNGEVIEALSITPAGVLIIPEARLSDAGEYICVAENEAGKRMSRPVIVEVKAFDDILTVTTKPENKCPELKECTTISSNAVDIPMGKSGSSVEDLCMDTNSFLQCVDNKLEDCEVALSPPDEDEGASFTDIGQWFTQFCNRFIHDNDELTSCDEFNSCVVDIEKLAEDNTTYWCNIVKSISGCANYAVQKCDLYSIASSLNEFHSRHTDIYCTGLPVHDVTPEAETGSEEVDPEPEGESYTTEPTDGNEGSEENTDGSSVPEVTSEPEGETGSKEDVQTDGDSDPKDGDDNGEDGNEENKEGGAAGKHNVWEVDGDDDNEDADRVDKDFVVPSKAKETYSPNSDTSEEKDSSSEDYDTGRVKEMSEREKNKDQLVGRQGPDADENSEEKDNIVSVDDNFTSQAGGDGSVNEVEDEDQDEAESSMVGASKEDSKNRSAVTGTSVLLATILQILTVVCLSWR